MFAAAVYTAVITNTANEREKDKEERAASSEWNFSLSLSLLHFLPPRLGLPVDEDEEDDDDEEEDDALDLLDLDLEDDEAAAGGEVRALGSFEQYRREVVARARKSS